MKSRYVNTAGRLAFPRPMPYTLRRDTGVLMVLPDNVHVLPQTQLQRVLMSRLRDVATDSTVFRAATLHLGRMLAMQAVGEIAVAIDIELHTPMETTTGYFFVGTSALVPILRAGLALEEPFRELLPRSKVWHLGMSRDHETLQPIPNASAVPDRIAEDDFGERVCFVLDPMLATGGSAEYAIRLLKERGAKRIVFVGIVGAPEGVWLLHKRHPDVPIHLAQLDRELNAKGYILPGLGDFGDRWTNSGS